MQSSTKAVTKHIFLPFLNLKVTCVTKKSAKKEKY